MSICDAHIFTSLTKTKDLFEIPDVWQGSQFMWVTSVLESIKGIQVVKIELTKEQWKVNTKISTSSVRDKILIWTSNHSNQIL